MRQESQDLNHLSTHAIGEAHEFLSAAVIVNRGGWTAAIPDPDRGGDLLTLNYTNGDSEPVQVKSPRETTEGPNPRAAAAADPPRRAFQFRVSPEQRRDLGRFDVTYIVWLLRNGHRPLALILPTEKMREIVGAGTVWLYQSTVDDLDIVWGSVNEDGRSLQEYVENWDVFTPHPDQRNQFSFSAASEALTSHQLVLRGWSVAKPHPDRGGDILAIRLPRILPIQAKGSDTHTVGANPVKAAQDGWNSFEINFTPTQVGDLLAAPTNTWCVIWLAYDNYDWYPLVFRGDQLMENAPGVWGPRQKVVWIYSTRDDEPEDGGRREINAVRMGGPSRGWSDILDSVDSWDRLVE